ncbi:MAG: histidinol-phosphate transaminase [Desulfovibrionaceae bacterium]
MGKKRVRPEILEFKPYTPGLNIEQIQERYGLDTVIKLASNENPLGASPVVRKVIGGRAAHAFRYPLNHSPALVEPLAASLGVAQELVVAGNGSDEIIDMLFRVVAHPGRDNVVCYESCFSMYRMCAKLCGVEYREVPRGPGFALPLEAMAEAADENTAMVIVTTPDNPTGLAVTVQALERLADALPEGTLLVVDGAYTEFARPAEAYDPTPLAASREDVVVLRTFSKAYGLAGLRLGYGVMPVWLADYLRRARIPFTVNQLAEAAGIAALEDGVFLAETLRTVFEGRAFLAGELGGLGCEVLPSESNFLMFRPGKDAALVHEGLLSRGIIVRPLASFGFGEWLRVNVGTMAENRALVAALEEVLAS